MLKVMQLILTNQSALFQCSDSTLNLFITLAPIQLNACCSSLNLLRYLLLRSVKDKLH